ncbi:MAG: phenylacetate--CoA ligase family protein [Saprospiraceae bacterium]|nr:phenylacetate--CoA ligase family protein [Saprospiraceae bacterium]
MDKLKVRNIRQLVYWAIDYLKGGVIKHHYLDIKEILENPGIHQKKNLLYLNHILNHAIKTVPYYSSLGIRPCLEDFPVVNKEIIRINQNQFLSNQFKKEKLYKVTTSGSTGTPFTVYKDPGKLARHKAENIYFSELAKYNFGTKLFYLRVWNNVNKKSALKCFFENLVMQDAATLDGKNLENFISKLKKDPLPKSILAFSSTCEGLVQYLDSKSEELHATNVQSIITISETLPQQVKQKLENYFNCPVISRYSNIENGFIAQQCLEENNEYHINNASFIIEILDLERDVPISEGNLGRIVITDLFNFGMPLIRYDTGDLGVLKNKSICSKNNEVFSFIGGRQVDFIYSTNKELLSPHVITNTMWSYPVKQFQFIQTSAEGYVLKLNVFDSKPDENSLLKDLKKYLGYDAKILIEYVDEIPVLSSGKRRKIINQMLK